MALTPIPGGGLWMPHLGRFALVHNFTSLIDATGEKVAFIGQVWTPTGGTKSIRKIHFRYGTVVKAGGSALTVSLQNVDTATGNPMRPDGVQDQTVAIPNADAGFVSNAWYTTGNLSADRSVAFGEVLAVVVEYDGSGRLGADTVQLATIPSNPTVNFPGVALFTAAWANLAQQPVLLLEFSDGTFGTFGEAYVWSALGTTGYNSGTGGADEYALEFQVPWDCQVDACWMFMLIVNTSSNFEMVLYDGTTPMTNGTISVDAHNTFGLGALDYVRYFPGLVTLLANTTYRLALKPTSTNNVGVYYGDVANAAYWGAMDGGTTWCLTSRVDLGAWAAPTTTRRPLMGLHFVSFNPSGGSGGPIGPGRLTGGMQ